MAPRALGVVAGVVSIQALPVHSQVSVSACVPSLPPKRTMRWRRAS
jgi:hypothetical protein